MVQWWCLTTFRRVPTRVPLGAKLSGSGGQPVVRPDAIDIQGFAPRCFELQASQVVHTLPVQLLALIQTRCLALFLRQLPAQRIPLISGGKGMI